MKNQWTEYSENQIYSTYLHEGEAQYDSKGSWNQFLGSFDWRLKREMAFAVGTEISNLEGGILTPKQIVRFDLRSLIAGKGVFWNQQRLSS